MRRAREGGSEQISHSDQTFISVNLCTFMHFVSDHGVTSHLKERFSLCERWNERPLKSERTDRERERKRERDRERDREREERDKKRNLVKHSYLKKPSMWDCNHCKSRALLRPHLKRTRNKIWRHTYCETHEQSNWKNYSKLKWKLATRSTNWSFLPSRTTVSESWSG